MVKTDRLIVLVGGGLALAGLIYWLTRSKGKMEEGKEELKKEQKQDEVKKRQLQQEVNANANAKPPASGKVSGMPRMREPALVMNPVFGAEEDEKKEDVDYSKVELDEEVHTKDKLIRILEASLPEYKATFASWYRLGLKMHDKDQAVNEAFIVTMESKLYQALTCIDEKFAKKRFDFDLKTFKALFKKYKHDPEVQKIIQPVEENLKRVARQEKPEFEIEYPKELDLKLFLKYLEIVYKQFQWKIYQHMKTEGVSSLNSKDFFEVVEQQDISQVKFELWYQLAMPKEEGVEVNAIVNNVQCDILLNHEDLADQLHELQREHKQRIATEISRGNKIPELEKEPVEEFLKLHGTYPFKGPNQQS